MKNLTWQNPEQLFVAQELINKVKSKCCGIKDYETRVLKAAIKVAGTCGIGLVMTLTSRKWGYMLSPLTIMTKKKLHSAVGTTDNTDKFNEMLVTSADSDLDFVYYK